MSSLTAAMGLGFAMGLRHALDADHVAAVATLLRREQGVLRAMRVGAMWGLGHSLSLLLAGAALGRLSLGARIEAIGERLVCAMLIGLGVLGLVRWRRGESPSEQPPRSSGGALGIGAVHGLAGTAATALLAASATGGGGRALLFLALFGAGTILGMSAMTALVGAGLAGAARRSRAMYRALLLIASLGSALVGLVLLVGLMRGGLTTGS